MAWIKMRTSLLSNPRVLRMARVLCTDAEFMEWYMPGRDTVTACDAVTKRDVSVVTRIVAGGLLGTWSAVNDTASSDGVLRHAASQDVDEFSGVPGFGKALIAVEWLRNLPNGEGIQFVNFEEHNSPQRERSPTSKTSAERMRALRERQANEGIDGELSDELSDAAGDGHLTSQGDAREDKSREEKNIKKGAKAPSSAAKLPPCPHQAILTLFAEKLPSLTQPKPELWRGSTGEEALRARWKWVMTAKKKDKVTRYATTEAEGLDWFGRYFDYVEKSDFLMARTGDFTCTLQWLAKSENFTKVVQGNYVNKT